MKAKHIIASISRTLLGLVFIFSGFVKAIDPLGTVYKIEDYLKAFGGFFTDLMPLAEPAAWILIIVEFTLGVMLLFNIRTNWTSWLSLAFYFVMTPLTLYIALTNPVSDCGCFGDAIILSNWATFWKNIVLTALVVLLLCTKSALRQTFTGVAECGITTFAIAFAAIWMAVTYKHLPAIDFRPYKIGNNIPQLMEIPEDAEPDVYETTLIYAKDGVEQEFTLQNYPKGDSTWTFVDQKSVLVKKGYEAPIHDFELLTLNFDDITYDILDSDEPQTLIIAYDLQKMDRKQLDNVRSIFNTVTNLHILTGSGEEEIMSLCDELGWDEETMLNTFCFTDPVTLKTIVRANPGVIVIQNGTIIDKYNIRQINNHLPQLN